MTRCHALCARSQVTGASDPYAVVSVGGSTGRTRVINANLNPVWDESFVLYVRNLSQDLLQVRRAVIFEGFTFVARRAWKRE